MSTLEIHDLDPSDESVLRPWYAVYEAALAASVGRDEAQVYAYDEARVQWQEQTSDQVRRGFVGTVDGVVVAVGVLALPQRDNLTSAFVEVAVHPDHQRRGIGRAVLEHVERAAAGAGRTLLNSEVRWRYAHGTDGHQEGGSRDVRFAEAAGFRVGLSDVQRWLDLPVEETLLDALAAEAAPHHAGYELRAWVGPVPDELAVGWIALDSTLTTEAPMGDLEHEPQDVDVARLREVEASVAKQRRVTYHAVALDGSGEVAAYTLLVQSEASTTAYQWGTLVHREHRGHRLGMALKVLNQRQLQRERPDAVRICTWNAEVNGHMIGVNERLGFRPVSRMGELQKRL